MRLKFGFILFILSCATFADANETDILEEARLLIATNQNIQALQLLESHMDANAGIPAYDYLLGKTSLALKKANLAIFALERVSLSEPSFDNARFLLAKAYLEAGEIEQASREFNLIIRSSNKEELREASKTYLQSIDDQKKAAKKSTSALLTFGMGLDSNANNATDNEKFGAIILDEKSLAHKSSIAKATLSGSFSYAINPAFRFHANAQVFKFEYADALFVNTDGGAASLGFSHNTKTNNQYISLDYQQILVDKTLNSKQISSSISHYQKFSDRFGMRGTFKAAEVNHHKKYRVADFRTVNGGFQLFHFGNTKNQESVTTSFSLIGGKEVPLNEPSQYGRKYALASLGLQLGSQNRKSSLNNNLTYGYSSYDKPVISKKRIDKTWSFSTQLNLKLDKKWTLSPEFRVMRTRSPIQLYEYDKMQLMLLVSRKLA